MLKRRLSVELLAITAIMIAVTTVFTIAIRIPIPATQGYVNFSDVAVFFVSFAFGPLVGLIAGGLGTALADITGGYAQFSLLTFLAHGLEGLVVGYASRSGKLTGLIFAWLLGTVAMAGVYFLGEGLILTGWGPALAELPFNVLQCAVGALVGFPLVLAVRRAYPPITRLGRRQTWKEE
jgi:uncharacterized membrane protein